MGARTDTTRAGGLVVEAHAVSRLFGERVALDGVDLDVRQGEIHALLGPNGAGKTTLLRVLMSLVEPTSGTVRILGIDAARGPLSLRRLIGCVPSGDRSFYLRLSALENLIFFGRLYGMTRRDAVARSRHVLAEVQLLESADVRVGAYSHGMQKRLAVARALLTAPPLLLLDEATHDLDPESSVRVRELVRAIARRGTAVVWATQRLEEIHGFAERVTLLKQGGVCFRGSVSELMAYSSPRRYLLRLRRQRSGDGRSSAALAEALAGMGTIEVVAGGDSEHHLLSLAQDAELGEALSTLGRAGFRVIGCREESSEIENAFLALTGDAAS